MKKLILILLFITTPVWGADKWSQKDIVTEIAFQTVNILDYASTDKILGDYPTRAIEMNPLLGSHPSRNTLIGATIGIGVAHALVTHYIPAKWRPVWQWGFISVKVGAVLNNAHVYVGLQF